MFWAEIENMLAVAELIGWLNRSRQVGFQKTKPVCRGIKS